MQGLINALWAILIISLLPGGAFAQQASNPPGDFPLHTTPEPPERQYDDRRVLLREERVLKKGLLAPCSEDRLAYEGFLREPKTGLIRLMPRESYDWEMYRAQKRIPMRGGGSFYSFANRTHAYGNASDITLEHNLLVVGLGGANFGMLTNLGVRSLEDITLNDPRTRFLAQYVPPKPIPAAHSEYRRFHSGVMSDGALYLSKLPVQVGATYLLRSVVYDDNDVLVGFRVARQDSDGSVIIAWKLLKKFPVPELSRR